jgi:4-amino-4-deoxy-L-arabinose transferase-like glycosyltransferase
MKRLHWVDWVAVGAILLLTVLYAATLADVPFHPDESTHIFMSRDISRNPFQLAWDGVLPLDNDDRLRAIDAPLARTLIGVVRETLSVPSLESDWNWSLNWHENQSAGALPSTRQLLVSRSVMVLLLPISLWLLFLVFKKILPAIPALLSVTLLGLNPLFLLHGRRAMSESPLIFGIALFLWAVTREKRNPWLIGLNLAIAINAKHSALGLVPAALLALVYLPEGFSGMKMGSINILKAISVVFAGFLLLNPFYWKQPISAIDAGLQARFTLAEDQREDHLEDEQILKKTIPGLLMNIYYTPPQTEEVGNYLVESEESKERYLSNPIHNWGRDLVTGSILISLSFVGIVFAFWEFSRKSTGEMTNLLVFVLAAAGLGVFTILLVPWQRYALALLPFTSCWIGFGLAPIFKSITPKTA